MRVVLDTNNVVSALLWGGPPKTLIQVLVAQNHASDALLAELARVLARPKFQPKFQAVGKSPNQVLEEFKTLAEIAVSIEVEAELLRDSDDRIALGCALGGNADCIVSGDQDLLTLGIYGDIPILTAMQLLERIQSTQQGTG